MSDYFTPQAATIEENTERFTRGVQQASAVPAERQQYTVKKPLALPKNFREQKPSAAQPSPVRGSSEASGEARKGAQEAGGGFWERERAQADSLAAIRAKNADRYNMTLPDWEYDALNDRLKQVAKERGLEAAEEERARFTNAWQYHRLYGIPMEDALANLDGYNTALFGAETAKRHDYKSITERLGDSWTQGVNAIRRSSLGNELMQAERDGDRERASLVWEAISALDAENEQLAISQPQSVGMAILTSGIQSLPYTGVAAAAGIVSGMVGVGPLGSFSAGYDLMQADSYINLRQAGAEADVARSVSRVSGALQAIVESSLGLVARGAVAGAKVAGKSLAGALPSAALDTLRDKVTKLAFTHFKMGSLPARMATAFAIHHAADIAEEGAEEAIQEVIDGLSFHVANAMSENGVETDDTLTMVRKSAEAFRGGVAGALLLGVFDTSLSARASVRDYRKVRDAAETIPSRAAFKKATKDSPVFSGMDGEKKAEMQDAIFDNFDAERAASERKAMDEVKSVTDVASGAEEQETDAEGWRVASSGEARDEYGRLYMQDDANVAQPEGGAEAGRVLFGDPTRPHSTEDGGNRYGYIDYSVAGDTVTIGKFVMAAGRENIRQEAFEQFAERFAGKHIEWDTRTEADAKVKQSIIDANPAGTKAGLDYFADRDTRDARTRMRVAQQLERYVPNITREQRPAAIVLAEALARGSGKGVSEWVDEHFNGGNMLTDRYATAETAAAAQAAEAAGGTVYGAAQFGKDAKAVIYASRHADFDTWAHELWHVAEKSLAPEERARVSRMMRDVLARQGKEWKGWDTATRELFADMGVDAIRTGRMPVRGLEDIFRKIAEFIAGVFRGFQGKVEMSDDILDTYASLLKGDGSMLALAEKAVKEAEEKRIEGERRSERNRRDEERREKARDEKRETADEHVARRASEIADGVIDDVSATGDERASAALDAAAMSVGEPLSDALRSVFDTETVDDGGALFLADNAETQRQMEAVRRQYAGTDAWMKAPNGEPSNLTERQWMQVRTPNFKRWFGNWEQSAQAERLKNNVIATVKKGAIKASEDMTVIGAAKKWISDHVKSPVLTAIGDIIVDERTIKNSLSHGFNAEKIDAIQAVPEVLQHGEYLGEKADSDGKTITNHFFAGRVNIGGDERIVFCRVRKSEGTEKRFYVHEVFSDDQIESGTPFKTGTAENGKKLGGVPLYVSILHDFLAVNDKDVSKVLDENGEPLVVYHGSSKWFTVFNEGKTNKSNVNTPDGTIFANDNKSIASSFENYYGGKVKDVILDKDSPLHKRYDWGLYREGGVYSLFMNLRNPKIVDYNGRQWNADGMNINKEVAKAMQEGYDGFIAQNIIDVGFSDTIPPASNDYIAFNNTAVKSATDNTGDFDPHNPSILFQIAGEIGAANLDAADEETREGKSRMECLAMAKGMEAAGKDTQTIRLATGWEKGADGLWRYEIDDSNVNFDKVYDELNNSEIVNYFGKKLELHKILDNAELFRAYPQLKNLIVTFHGATGDGTRGSYSALDNSITLFVNKNDEWKVQDSLKSTLLHEVQHAIQHIEGFVPGGRPEMFETKDFSKEKMNKLLEKAHALFEAQDDDWKTKVRRYNEAEINEDYDTTAAVFDEMETDAAFNEYVDLRSRALAIKNGTTSVSYVKTPDEQYRSLSGEVEARNVQRRMDMTAAERARTLLALTEDVAREDQIMLRSAQGALFQTAYHGSGASFDRFDTAHYGLSGEGSMTFGWGVYLSESEKIARDYAERQRKHTLDKYSENPYDRGTLEHEMFNELRDSFNFSKKLYKAYLEKEVENIKNEPDNPYQDFKAADKLTLIDKFNYDEGEKTNLYTVDIPDGKYLQWDKHLPEQELNTIKAALQNRGYTDFSRLDNLAELQKTYADNPGATYTLSSNIYKVLVDLLGSKKAASQFLHSIGYTGIDYPAGTIYGNGNDARNYVIFDDKDIQIKEHVLFQTEKEMLSYAAEFGSWEDWKADVEGYRSAFGTDDTNDAVPDGATDTWYRTAWEKARQIADRDASDGGDIDGALGISPDDEETRRDRMWYEMMKEDGVLDEFLVRLADTWMKIPESPRDRDEHREATRVMNLRSRLGRELKHGSWSVAALKARIGTDAEGKVPLSDRTRKTLLTLMRRAKRDYRDIWAAVMQEDRWRVAAGMSSAEKLAGRIASPVEETESLTPEERRVLAERLDFEDLKKEVKAGTLEMDWDNVEKLVRGYETDIRTLTKKIEKIKARSEENERDLVYKNAELEKLMAEVKQKQVLRKQAEQVRDIKIRLIKDANRKVDFRRVNYDEGRKILAVQALFQPLLLKYVDGFLNSEGPYIRDAYSRYRTDYGYRTRLDMLANAFPGKGARKLKRLVELFETKSFEKWTDEERLFVAETLPRTDWVRELRLEELSEARKGALQLDLQSEETQEILRDTLPPELLAYIAKNELKAWTLEQMEELTRVVNDLFHEGRENLKAKREADIRRADDIRDRIVRSLKSSGIEITDADSDEEKERKKRQIERWKERMLPRILGTANGAKGTLAAGERGMMAFFNRVLHGYGTMNVRRIARILDNGHDGANTALLYWREDECFNREKRAVSRQQDAMRDLMERNGIGLSDLYRTVEVTLPNTMMVRPDAGGKMYEAKFEDSERTVRLTVDELLYAMAASENESSYRAVAGGNLFDETVRAKFRDTDPKAFELMAKARMDRVLDKAKELLNDPDGGEKWRKLLAAVQRAYDDQGKRLNETAIRVYNQPLWIEEHYVPLNRLEANGDTNEKKLADEMLATMTGTGSAGSWLERGMMKKRVEISCVNQKPVRMGLVSTWTESVESTEHVIAYAELVRDLNRVYRGRDGAAMRQYMENRHGKDMVSYIDQYIKEVANPDAWRNPKTDLDRIVHSLRGRTAPAYLAWKASGIIKQLCTSPWPYMQFMSPLRYARACMECMRPATQDAIKAKSAYMASRVFDPLMDLVKEQQEKATSPLAAKWGAFQKMGMQGLEAVDWCCVAPGWLAAYQDEHARLSSDEAQDALVAARRKELEQYRDANGGDWVDAEAEKARLSEDEIERLAVRKADDIVRMSQPSGRATDLAPIFKGGNELSKAFLQFTASLNVIWQNIRSDLPQAVRMGEWRKAIGMVAGYVLAGVSVGLVCEGFEDDDDDAEAKALRLAYWSMTQFTDAVPAIGSAVTSTVEGLVTGRWGYGNAMSSLFPVLDKGVDAARYASKGAWDRALLRFGEAVGVAAGAPVSGLREALYVAGVGDGDGVANFHPTAFVGRRPD